MPDPQIRPIPLNVGGPTDPEHMVGRGVELRRVFEAFSSVGVVITGERRLGKTSLATLVALEAQARGWDVVRQNAQGFTTLADFSAALVSRLDETTGPLHKAATVLRERWTFKAAGIQIAPANAPRLLDDVVTTAVQASRERLLLILDELPVLARALERAEPGAGMAMLHILRRLRQEHPDRLRMLCLGSIGFHHAMRGDSQGALNDMDPQRLDPLSSQEATYLAACIFRHAVLDAIASERRGLTFAEVCGRLAADPRLAPIDDDRVRDVQRRLAADHYLIRDGDRRRFAFSLIRRAWIAHRT